MQERWLTDLVLSGDDSCSGDLELDARVLRGQFNRRRRERIQASSSATTIRPPLLENPVEPRDLTVVVRWDSRTIRIYGGATAPPCSPNQVDRAASDAKHNQPLVHGPSDVEVGHMPHLERCSELPNDVKLPLPQPPPRRARDRSEKLDDEPARAYPSPPRRARDRSEKLDELARSSPPPKRKRACVSQSDAKAIDESGNARSGSGVQLGTGQHPMEKWDEDLAVSMSSQPDPLARSQRWDPLARSLARDIRRLRLELLASRLQAHGLMFSDSVGRNDTGYYGNYFDIETVSSPSSPPSSQPSRPTLKVRMEMSVPRTSCSSMPSVAVSRSGLVYVAEDALVRAYALADIAALKLDTRGWVPKNGAKRPSCTKACHFCTMATNKFTDPKPRHETNDETGRRRRRRRLVDKKTRKLLEAKGRRLSSCRLPPCPKPLAMFSRSCSSGVGDMFGQLSISANERFLFSKSHDRILVWDIKRPSECMCRIRLQSDRSRWFGRIVCHPVDDRLFATLYRFADSAALWRGHYPSPVCNVWGLATTTRAEQDVDFKEVCELTVAIPDGMGRALEHGVSAEIAAHGMDSLAQLVCHCDLMDDNPIGDERDDSKQGLNSLGLGVLHAEFAFHKPVIYLNNGRSIVAWNYARRQRISELCFVGLPGILEIRPWTDDRHILVTRVTKCHRTVRPHGARPPGRQGRPSYWWLYGGGQPSDDLEWHALEVDLFPTRFSEWARRWPVAKLYRDAFHLPKALLMPSSVRPTPCDHVVLRSPDPDTDIANDPFRESWDVVELCEMPKALIEHERGRLAFLMGTHARAGAESAIRGPAFASNPLYDPSVLNLIFQLARPDPPSAIP